MKHWMEWLQKQGGTGKAHTWWILALGIGGMLLILASEFWPEQTPAASQPASAAADFTYEAQLEQRLADMIGQISGAGQTRVLVTLESGSQTVYAVDTREGEAESEQTHVLLEDGSALTETVRTPAVCGVAVVCEGGDQIHVVTQITEMLSSLLDIPTSRISVAKMSG